MLLLDSDRSQQWPLQERMARSDLGRDVSKQGRGIWGAPGKG